MYKAMYHAVIHLVLLLSKPSHLTWFSTHALQTTFAKDLLVVQISEVEKGSKYILNSKALKYF